MGTPSKHIYIALFLTGMVIVQAIWWYLMCNSFTLTHFMLLIIWIIPWDMKWFIDWLLMSLCYSSVVICKFYNSIWCFEWQHKYVSPQQLTLYQHVHTELVQGLTKNRWVLQIYSVFSVKLARRFKTEFENGSSSVLRIIFFWRRSSWCCCLGMMSKSDASTPINHHQTNTHQFSIIRSALWFRVPSIKPFWRSCRSTHATKAT